MSMKLRVSIATGMICLVVAFLFASDLPPVRGQAPVPAVQWEYKAETFSPDNRNDDHTKQLNNLASEGWEYAGLLIPPYDSNHRLAPESVVAFRRMKQN